MSAAHKAEKVFVKILSNVQFLAISLFLEMVMKVTLIFFNSYYYIKEWVQKKTNKYTSAEIQNEQIRLMALQVLRHKPPLRRDLEAAGHPA